jgi:hypothetical protein
LFRANGENLVQLDREPRRKPGDAKKTVYFSNVEDLKTAIITRSLEDALDDEEVAPIPVATPSLGTSFCGIPLEEFADAEFAQDS